MTKTNDIAANLQTIRHQIEEAAQNCGRNSNSVRLLAVSKTQTSTAIEQAYAAGQLCFGENYLQEALEKMEALSHLNIEWHFIGRIQSNKTRKIAENFAWVQSLSDAKIAHRLNEQRPTHLEPLNVCIEVNIDADPNKDGIQVQYLLEFSELIVSLPRLRLRGLMTIPHEYTNTAQQRQPFQRLKQAYDDLLAHGFILDTLSMGMSQDFPAAIAEGATLVRIGTAIFGAR